MMKYIFKQKDVTILNLQASNNIILKYIKQKLTKLGGEIDKIFKNVSQI